ncbi:hypothetical protein WJX72_002800 [[Myrmecia] bisecta]|uniref:Uncharacterized protein n=1 Tax=[Myrmecia] bisecta TaxID=41462 RepID=A0AAW1PLC6_9CHLO
MITMATRLTSTLQFEDGALEVAFRHEHALYWSRFDDAWAIISATLFMLVVRRVSQHGDMFEYLLAVACVLVATIPLYLNHRHKELWIRYRSQLMGLTFLYKSVASMILTVHFVKTTPVHAWQEAMRFVLLNGRIAILWHFTLGIRLLFRDYLLAQLLLLPLLLGLAPTTCRSIQAPGSHGPELLADLCGRIEGQG